MTTRNDTDFLKYKFRDLKVYSSTEWLADNKKKYRQVFDRYETSYIYTELSFYNKLFDEDDWDVTINLKCFSLKKGRKELCDLNFDRKVSKYDNIVYVREGWGNKKEGAFWKRGTYFWEAYIDGIKVATKYFYIEDTGKTWVDMDSYLKIKSIKLYEAPYDDPPKDERRYYTTFSADETRYVYTEITMENVLRNRNWFCEFIIKFYNGSRELKGQNVRLHRVEKDETSFEITANWGSNIKGSWRPDHYTAEIIFMDKLIAVIPFEIGESFEEGIATISLPQRQSLMYINADHTDDENFDDVLSELNGMVGLSEIKNKVQEHARYLKFIQLRRQKGFPEEDDLSIHSVFSGNPGTGKTTVARMLGKLYKKMGLLSKGHLLEVDRVDLVGEYIGQTAPKVKEVIERARGGVLFIDEAYALARTGDDTKDFGREVVEILIKEMSEGKNDMAVVVAGYPKEMKHFLDSNPGLRSRFKMHFDFTDYLPQELSQIAEYACSRKNIILSDPARVRLDEVIVEAFRKRNRTFGNARYVNDLVDQAKLSLGLRIMKMENPESLSKETISTVIEEDINAIEMLKPRRLPNIPVDDKLLKECLEELDSLTGIENIKKEIRQMVQLVRYYRDTGKDVLNQFFLHTVFVGNPGTGKTTVARILAKIYKALGILERGHIIETDRQGLIAGFVGQTAIKTTEKIDEAIGGVLFIDEAYGLSDGGGNMRTAGDYGAEAIQTILKRMEDHRGEFFVFVAGYPENMENFLKSNPGLRSRFDKTLRFEDYKPEDLNEIALRMIHEEGLEPDDEAREHLRKYLEFLHANRDKYFGNARAVRQIITETVRHQSLRLSAIGEAERTPEAMRTLTREDLSNLTFDKSSLELFRRAPVGFRVQE